MGILHAGRTLTASQAIVRTNGAVSRERHAVDHQTSALADIIAMISWPIASPITKSLTAAFVTGMMTARQTGAIKIHAVRKARHAAAATAMTKTMNAARKAIA